MFDKIAYLGARRQVTIRDAGPGFRRSHPRLPWLVRHVGFPAHRPCLARHLSIPGHHFPFRLPLVTQEGLLCFRMQPFATWRWRESPSVAHFVCAPCGPPASPVAHIVCAFRRIRDAGPGFRPPCLARHLSIPGHHSPFRLPPVTQEGLLCFRMQPFKFWRWRESNPRPKAPHIRFYRFSPLLNFRRCKV